MKSWAIKAGRALSTLVIAFAVMFGGVAVATAGQAFAQPTVSSFNISQFFDDRAVSAGWDSTGLNIWQFYAPWLGLTSGTIAAYSVGPYGAETPVTIDRIRIMVDHRTYANYWATLPATASRGGDIVNHPVVAVNIYAAQPEEEFAVYLCVGTTRFPLVRATVSDGMVIKNKKF